MRRLARGFTIIELMIATLVFSTILVLISVGLIQIARLYYKGITTTRTQQTARSIMDTISRDIQFSGGTIGQVQGGGPYFFCVNNTRYTFLKDTQLVSGTPDPAKNQANNVFIKDTPPSCGGGPADMVDLSRDYNPVEMMGINMRLSKFVLCRAGDPASPPSCPTVIPLASKLYQISLGVVAGDNDLLDAAHSRCSGLKSGTQFCALSELQTAVQKRL